MVFLYWQSMIAHLEITQKKLEYDHTNTILVSALCNYIPMSVWIKLRFLLNSQQNLTCPIITVLMFALLVKVNSTFYKLVIKCVELDAQGIKASIRLQHKIEDEKSALRI